MFAGKMMFNCQFRKILKGNELNFFKVLSYYLPSAMKEKRRKIKVRLASLWVRIEYKTQKLKYHNAMIYGLFSYVSHL
jgi:hypothetical protein